MRHSLPLTVSIAMLVDFWPIRFFTTHWYTPASHRLLSLMRRRDPQSWWVILMRVLCSTATPFFFHLIRNAEFFLTTRQRNVTPLPAITVLLVSGGHIVPVPTEKSKQHFSPQSKPWPRETWDARGFNPLTETLFQQNKLFQNSFYIQSFVRLSDKVTA